MVLYAEHDACARDLPIFPWSVSVVGVGFDVGTLTSCARCLLPCDGRARSGDKLRNVQELQAIYELHDFDWINKIAGMQHQDHGNNHSEP